MQKKTIQKVIRTKIEDWLESITDKGLSHDLRSNVLVSGGSIASMLLKEPVNDYDVYIKDMDVLLRLVKYYTAPNNLEIFDGRKKQSLIDDIESNYDDEVENVSNARTVSIRNLKEDQIKINAGSGFRVERDENIKYQAVFFSPNAISLSDDVQIVCRFHGDSEKIHSTFDFIHATNYFTFSEGLVLNIDALTSLITRQLKYQGSMYPLTSIIRVRKFIKRGWNIGAGELLKIMFQISELDLRDPDVMEEQLIGVDVAYFSTLVDILRNTQGKDMTSSYLNEIIDRVFDSSELED